MEHAAITGEGTTSPVLGDLHAFGHGLAIEHFGEAEARRLAQALGIAHRADVLEKGRVSASGSARSLASDPQVVASYLGGS